GRQIVNVSVPESEALPGMRDADESFERLIRTGKPVVGEIVMDPVMKQWSFAVRVPVIREGTIKYVFSAAVRPDAIAKIIKAQNLGADWGAAVLDRNNRFVARHWDPEHYLGQLASPSLREALDRSPSGWF